MTKGQLRAQCLRRLQLQKEDERRRSSEAIQRKVFRLTAFRTAKTVGCYVALPYEVQTWQMIEDMLAKGKRVVVPVMQPRAKRLSLSEVRDPATELSRGPFGVWEPKPSARRPVPLRDVDLWLVSNLLSSPDPYRVVLHRGLPFQDVHAIPDPHFQRPLIGIRALRAAALRVELDFLQDTVSVWTPDVAGG